MTRLPSHAFLRDLTQSKGDRKARFSNASDMKGPCNTVRPRPQAINFKKLEMGSQCEMGF